MNQPNNKLIDVIVLILTMILLFTALPIYADMTQPIYEYVIDLIK